MLSTMRSLLLLLTALSQTEAFSPQLISKPLAPSSSLTTKSPLPSTTALGVRNIFGGRGSEKVVEVVEEKVEDSSWSFNPVFGGMAVVLLAFASKFAPGQFSDPKDFERILSIVNQDGTVNPLFTAVFNDLGIMPLIMACLIFPQASTKGLPAMPFVGTSVFAGYFALSPYLTFRAPPVESKSRDELAFVAKNVLESRLFGAALTAMALASPVASGVFSSGQSLEQLLSGYQELFSSSLLASVSTADLFFLSIAAALLIPKDYKLRVSEEEAESSNIEAWAASTVLLPVLGAAIYCALRPSLPNEDSA